MTDLMRELQGSLGRNLTDRESAAVHRLIEEHGLPAKIQVGDPWFKDDARRPVWLGFVIGGELTWVLLPPSAPAAKPRDLGREHIEQYRRRGWRVISERRRIGLDGRCTIQRDTYDPPADAVPPPRRVTPRARGAGRPKAQSTRSSARSGDSGDDGPSSEPPQAGQRICALDECDRPARRKYCTEKHAGAARKRRQRARDKANPDRIWQRKADRLATAERLDRLIADLLPAGCRCPGQGIERDPEGDWICVSCGRPLKVPGSSPNGYDARMAEVRNLMRNDTAEGRQVHRRHRHRDWRTRPTRKLSAKLRPTMREDVDVSILFDMSATQIAFAKRRAA